MPKRTKRNRSLDNTESLANRGGKNPDFYIFLVLGVLAVINCSAVQSEGDTCGMLYDSSNGTIQYHKKSPGVPQLKTDCNWTISDNGTENGVFLIVTQFELQDTDKVMIQKSNFTVDIVPTISGKTAQVGIFTGESEIGVKLVAESFHDSSRKFQMHYENAGCLYTIAALGAGTFSSPIYNATYAKIINCTFDLAASSSDKNSLLLHFPKFNLTNGNLSIKTKDKADPIVFTGNDKPGELIAPGAELNFVIPNATIVESFTLFYELVSKACSGNIELDKNNPSKPLVTPDVDELEYSFNCRWLVTSEIGTFIKVEMSNVVFKETTDQILILDGPNRTSSVLAFITKENKDKISGDYILSSANALWISVTSESLSNMFVSHLTVSQNTVGGSMKNNGSFEVKGNDFVYLLEVDPSSQVELTFDNTTLLAQGSSLVFYSGFSNQSDEFASMDSTQKDFSKNPLAAPGNRMRIEGKSFKGSTLKGSFKGITKGCFYYGNGNTGTFSLFGHCNESCTWTIPPSSKNSTDNIVLHFSILQLAVNDSLIISKLDSTKAIVANVTSEVNQLPDIIVPSNSGVFVEVIRGDCVPDIPAVEATFLIQQACSRAIKLSSGTKVEIVSPNYPNHYPLEASCSWNISRPTDSSLIYVSAEVLEFVHNHSVAVYSIKNSTEKLIASFNGTNLPNDLLVDSDLIIRFNSSTEALSSGLKSATGFNLSLTLIDYGGNVISSGAAANVTLLPKSVNGSIFAWSLSVPIQNTTTLKNIIQYELKNTTKAADLKSVLTIYDGSSIRSRVVNLTAINDTEILSRTSSIILIYRRESPTAPLKEMIWTFSPFACNSSLMCTNGVCMHEDWVCNGKNDCDDWSDEKYCNGPGPGPGPEPTPGPPPTTTGTSTTALTLGILASLIIGILLGVAAPVALHRIRGNRFSSYSTFSNSGE